MRAAERGDRVRGGRRAARSRARRPRSPRGGRCASSPSAAARGRADALGAAVRGPRRGAAPAQGAAPCDRARPADPARVDHRPGAASARAGSPGSSRSTSTGSARTIYWHRGRLAGLRRGDHVLGARRDGPPARRPAEDDDEATTRERIADDAWPSTSRTTPTDRVDRARAPRAARPGDRRRPAAATTLFAAWRMLLRADRATGHDRPRSSRTSSGPTAGCSTSSSSCSTGRKSLPIIVVTLARPELLRPPARLGRAGRATSPRSRSSH